MKLKKLMKLFGLNFPPQNFQLLIELNFIDYKASRKVLRSILNDKNFNHYLACEKQVQNDSIDWDMIWSDRTKEGWKVWKTESISFNDETTKLWWKHDGNGWTRRRSIIRLSREIIKFQRLIALICF